MVDSHTKLGTYPSPINELSGSVDSRLHTNVQFCHDDSYTSPDLLIWAVGYDGLLKKTFRLTGLPPSPPSLMDQIEDMAYFNGNIYITNCGNNSLNRNTFWIYRFNEPASLASPGTVTDIAINGWWKFTWPGAVTGVDCEAMVIGPSASDLPQTICFIPKTSNTTTVGMGLYAMPKKITELVADGNGTFTYELVKKASWSNIGAPTRADWKPDGSEIVVAGNFGGPDAVNQTLSSTKSCHVFSGKVTADGSFVKTGVRDLAVAWKAVHYDVPPNYNVGYQNENLHFLSDGSAVIVGAEGAGSDMKKTIWGGTTPPPPPSTLEDLWKVKSGTTWKTTTVYENPADKNVSTDPYAAIYAEAKLAKNDADAAVQAGDFSKFTTITTAQQLIDAATTSSDAAPKWVRINSTITMTQKLRVKSGFAMYLTANGRLIKSFPGTTKSTFIETHGMDSAGTGYYNAIVPSHNVYIGGPGEISQVDGTPGGNMLALAGNNIVFDSFKSTFWDGGRYVVLIGDDCRVRNVNWNMSQPARSGVGGLRYMGGQRFRCIDSYCYSGDDVWQCVPAGAPTDPMFDVSINDCYYMYNTGRSYSARFMVCGEQHADGGGTANMTGSITNVHFIGNVGYSGGTSIALQNLSSSGDIANIEFVECEVSGEFSVPVVQDDGTGWRYEGQGGAIFLKGSVGEVKNITFKDVKVWKSPFEGLRTDSVSLSGQGASVKDVSFTGGYLERASDPAGRTDTILHLSDPIVFIDTNTLDFSMDGTQLNRKGYTTATYTDNGTSSSWTNLQIIN